METISLIKKLTSFSYLFKKSFFLQLFLFLSEKLKRKKLNKSKTINFLKIINQLLHFLFIFDFTLKKGGGGKSYF